MEPQVFDLNEHYQMEACYELYKNGRKRLYAYITPKDRGNKYLERIRLNDDKNLNPTEENFGVDSAWGGELYGDKLLLFIDAMNIIYETIQTLAAFDWSQLPVIEQD